MVRTVWILSEVASQSVQFRIGMDVKDQMPKMPFVLNAQPLKRLLKQFQFKKKGWNMNSMSDMKSR